MSLYYFMKSQVSELSPFHTIGYADPLSTVTVLGAIYLILQGRHIPLDKGTHISQNRPTEGMSQPLVFMNLQITLIDAQFL